MMKKGFMAEVQWLKFEEGGRHTPLSKGVRYCPIIRFDNVILEGEWSVCLISSGENDQKKSVEEIRFLSDDIPAISIPSGSSFGLYEGIRKVAAGRVV